MCLLYLLRGFWSWGHFLSGWSANTVSVKHLARRISQNSSAHFLCKNLRSSLKIYVNVEYQVSMYILSAGFSQFIIWLCKDLDLPVPGLKSVESVLFSLTTTKKKNSVSLIIYLLTRGIASFYEGIVCKYIWVHMNQVEGHCC